MQNLWHILEKWNLWIVLWFWEQVEAAHTHVHTLPKTHTQTQVTVLRNTLDWWNWGAEIKDPIEKNCFG